MASMNTRLNIKKLDGNIVQKHGCSKQVGFKQLGPCVETRVHGVHDEKRVWFEVKPQGAQGDREVEVFQVSNDDTIVAQRWLEDKQPEEKTNTDCLSGLSEVLWAEDTTMSTYLVNKGCLNRLRSSFGGIVGIDLWRFDDDTIKGTGSMQALQGDEFEVEPQDGHTFEVKPHGNVDHVVASQEVQTQDLIYYHPARDREQHSVWELFSIEKTVSCEVISKWKVGLKDDMDAWSHVYVLNNGCRKSSDDVDGYYWEYTPDLDYQGIHNEKLVQTLLKGHSILSLEGSLSGDCDVEKNGKWSCIYAVGSQEYQMVCTRLDIASADVGMLDKFDRGLQTDVQVFVDFDYAMAAYMTLTGAWKKEIWLKGLLAESGYELSLVAGIATGALVKGGSRSEVPAQVEGAAYRY
ncbi:hypothetical protein Tco_0300856 [Tanacetum coccineum]